MQSSPTILLVLVCGFFVLMLGMMTIAVFFMRKETALKAKIARSLGLTPAADAQPLLQRVAYVNGSSPDLYRLEHVFQRHDAQGGDIYLFSLHRRDIKAPTFSQPSGSSKIRYFPIEVSALAFVSPSWQLPRFTALPRLSGGALADISNDLSEAAANIKQEVVKFPHILNLDVDYIITTPEAPASLASLPDGFWQALEDNPNLRLHAGADMLTLSYPNANYRTPDEDKMKQLYKIGMQLARGLQK